MTLNKLSSRLLPPVAFALVATISQLAVASGPQCADLLRSPRFAKMRTEVQRLTFNMPGMKVASLSDPTLSTGGTIFSFDEGATAGFDAGGGSVAAVETSLLELGSYSNVIDGILFAGGSTMGHEAHQGARRRVFAERAQNAGSFDFIPSFPGAIVYDYGGRVERSQEKLVFPNMVLGAALYDQAVEGSMYIGRAGAGTTTTANKVSRPIWGGQGAAFKEIDFPTGWGKTTKIKVFTAVILNPHGNVTLPNGTVLDEKKLEALREKQLARSPGQNTTLSLVVTDVSLNPGQLHRLARMVHTSMARSIHPFQSYTDGDICFAVSLNKVDMPTRPNQVMALEEELQNQAAALMQTSIMRSALISNGVRLQGEGLD